MRLVVYGPPEPDEALFGYLQRLCSVNGYSSVATMLGANAIYLRPLCTAEHAARTAAAIGASARILRWISYDSSGRGWRHRDRWYARAQVDWRPKVCPQCLAERAVHLGIWHLGYWTTCPRHGCALMAFCSGCGERLGLMRSHVDACRCGTSLTGPGKTASEAHHRFALLLAHAHGVGPEPDRSDPGRLVAHLEPHELMSLTRMLGCRELGIQIPNGDEPRVAAAFMAVLDGWPRSVHRMFRRMDGVADDGRCGKIAQASRGLVNPFVGPQFKFLTREFDAHKVRIWTHKVESGGRTAPGMKVPDKPYLTRSEAAAAWGTSIDVVGRLVKAGLIPAIFCRVRLGMAALIPRESVAKVDPSTLRDITPKRPRGHWPRRKKLKPGDVLPGPVMSHSAVSAHLGYRTSSAPGELVRRGLLRAAESAGATAILTSSVAELLTRLREFAVRTDESACPFDRLRSRHKLRPVDVLVAAVEERVELVRRRQGKGLDAYGIPDDAARRLQLEEYRSTGLIPVSEAARRLRVPARTVQELVKAGLLPHIGRPHDVCGRNGIATAAVEEFARRFVLGAEIMRLHGDTVASARVSAFLRRHGIERIRSGMFIGAAPLPCTLVVRRSVEHLLRVGATPYSRP